MPTLILRSDEPYYEGFFVWKTECFVNFSGKLIKKIGTLLLVCVLALSLAACGQSDNGGSADEGGEKSITIAVAAPMTGDNAAFGFGFANAA